MTQYWFYHLEASALEQVLPELLIKTQGRGWRSLVKCPAERLAELDKLLWTFRDDAFLPHGLDTEPFADLQPVLLTAEAESTAGVDCAFLIDGCDIHAEPSTQRVLVLINGRRETAVQQARRQWSALKQQKADLSYWQQTAQGRWEKKA